MITINQKDCLTTRKNLGLPDCILQEGRLTGFIIVPKGWALNLTTDTFDQDYVNEQIQLGNFTPVLGAVQAENKTPEATTEEFQGGVKTVVRNGLPEYTFKFVRGGWKFASALYTYNSFQAFDVLFVFSTGSIAGATTAAGTFTGFDLGMLNNGTYMFTDGATASNVMVSMQLMNEVQFNRDVALLDSSVLDFNPNTDINPVTDIVMTGRADVSDNKFYFKAHFAMNEATTLMGISQPNIIVYNNGVEVSLMSLSLVYNTSTDEYSVTSGDVFLAGDKIIISLYDGTVPADAAKIGTRYYKGVTPEITAVA